MVHVRNLIHVSEDGVHGNTSARCRLNHCIIQQLYHLQSKFADLKSHSVNVEIILDMSGETAELLQCRLVDIYCVQDTIFG